ncbi:MAG: hypothetical protein AAGA93_26330 [Actinomycetota bacterium]
MGNDADIESVDELIDPLVELNRFDHDLTDVVDDHGGIRLEETSVSDAVGQLDRLIEHDGFWRAVSSIEGHSIDAVALTLRSSGFAATETRVMAEQLARTGPDAHRLAQAIMANSTWADVPTLLVDPAPVRAGAVVFRDHLEVHHLQRPDRRGGDDEAQQGWGRTAIWLLKRAAKIAGGGLAVAANVVSPDVTGITKVASIAGGASTMLDGIPSRDEMVQRVG